MTKEGLRFRFQVPREDRLDHLLVELLPDYSRARLQGLIKDHLVRVDGVPARKSGQILGLASAIDVEIPAPVKAGLTAENFPLEIIYENHDLIVVNKPAGMVVHPSPGHHSGTLVHGVLGHDPNIEGIGGEERPGVVHRLDKDTSGLILIAKNDASHHWLQDQFRLRKVEKTYLALVDGNPPTPSGRVEAAIGRDSSHRKKMAIVSHTKGREAISEYKTLEVFPNHTLLEFHPLTGRTHQIRIHCTFLKCPIVGDVVYGRKNPSIEISRHFLHAYKLNIILPGEKHLRTFEAPLPGELASILVTLRRNS